MPDHPSKPAVVLLSGGLDSATVLAMARGEGFACYCLTFDYGQRHRHELIAAARVARSLGAAEHRVAKIDLRAIGGSALTADIGVPHDRDEKQMAGSIPVTYVPARNTIFLSHALGWAEVLGTGDIWIGVNAVDFSGYPDCRPEYVEAFERMANLATKASVEGKARVKIHTPLIAMTKSQIIRLGLGLGVDYSLTHSCYDPGEGGIPCGHCDACLIRARAFAELGMADPGTLTDALGIRRV